MKGNKRKKVKGACDLSLVIFLVLLFFIHTNYAMGTQKNIIIKGNISNIPPNNSPNNIHLYSYHSNGLSEIASAMVNRQGDFKLELKDTLQRGLYKIGLDQNNAASIVLSEEVNDITIKARYGQLKADKITVTNSRENKAYRALLSEGDRMVRKMVKLKKEKSQVSPVDPFFIRKTKGLEDKMRMLTGEYNVNILYLKETYPETFMAEDLINLSLLPRLIDHPELEESYDNERAFMHDYYFEFVDFADERLIYNPFHVNKYFTYLDQYTQHTPQGFMDSVDIILSKAEANSVVREFTIEFMIDVFNERGPEGVADYIMDNYVEGCSTPLSERVVEKMENIGWFGVGQIAPEIVSEDPEGNTIALSSLIKENNVLMVYFWASWCDVCKTKNPNIVRLYNKFKDRGLGVYAVALESDKEKWIMAIKEHQFTWTNVSDLKGWKSNTAKTYRVYKTPSLYLLDKKGIIMAKNLKGNELEAKIEEILNRSE